MAITDVSLLGLARAVQAERDAVIRVEASFARRYIYIHAPARSGRYRARLARARSEPRFDPLRDEHARLR